MSMVTLVVIYAVMSLCVVRRCAIAVFIYTRMLFVLL